MAIRRGIATDSITERGALNRIGLVALIGTMTLSAAAYGLVEAWDQADVPARVNTRLDIGDFYSFTRGDRVVFVMTLSPFLEAGEVTDAARLGSGALYQFHLDRERDGIADAVIQVAAVGSGTHQRIDVRGPVTPDSTGALTLISEGSSVQTEFGVPFQSASLSAWAGPADDPFFGNLYGNESLTSILNSLYSAGLGVGVGSAGEQTRAFLVPGEDDLAETNVLAIVVEVPKTAVAGALGIGASGTFHAWASTSEAP